MSCPVVSTKNGKVNGYVEKLSVEDAKPVYVYRNIPFAKAPTGSLRFMPPQPAEPWTGVRDGSIVGNMPMQSPDFAEMMNTVVPMKLPSKIRPAASEDCLHLTVYTPNPEKGKRLPVMVWFYGGGFHTGLEAWYGGSALAGMNDVIVVVPNYRVGIFGFLSLGPSSVCSGNAGIMDQRLALEWVKENIKVFGGDERNVTIFGESAGGAAVHFHVTSPPSRGLFHKAISQSGQSSLPGTVISDEKAKKAKEAILKHFKIEETDEMKVLGSLQKIPAADLEKAYETILMTEQAYFAVVVDGKVVPKMPEELMSTGEFAKVPYLLGCNNTEGFGLLSMDAGPQFETGLNEEETRNAWRLHFFPDEEFEACKKFYIKDETDEKRFSKMLGNVIGDRTLVAPCAKTAAAHHAAGCDVYVYMGAFPLRMQHDAEYGPGITKRGDWCICDHGNDIYMVFGMCFTPGDLPHGARFSEEEAHLSRQVMAYITNFAKHGDPNKGAKVPKQWPKYRPGGDHIIFAHPVKVGKMFSPEVIEFWSQKFPAFKE